jgi:hypothetical protein
MAESATQRYLKALNQIELDLLLQVEQARAKFHGSLNGNREAAAREYEAALRIFSDLIIRHELPRAESVTTSISGETIH